MTQSTNVEISPDRGRTRTAPPAVIWSIGGIVGAVCLGAVYLILVRGEAILQDLSALSGYLLCF